ncbi:hypothetical protein TYRP_017110 [Tyrophagus putrescentiae]|nr:hypothetical protein TYRP_017110 [Tyrophagus putrescentiae]
MDVPTINTFFVKDSIGVSVGCKSSGCYYVNRKTGQCLLDIDEARPFALLNLGVNVRQQIVNAAVHQRDHRFQFAAGENGRADGTHSLPLCYVEVEHVSIPDGVVRLQLTAIAELGKVSHKQLLDEDRVGDGQRWNSASVNAVEEAKTADIAQLVLVRSGQSFSQGEAKRVNGPRTGDASSGPVVKH